MSFASRTALLALLAVLVGASSAAGFASGGVSISSGGLAPVRRPAPKLPPLPSRQDHGRWLSGATITEYWPAPESWFVGRRVKAPGLPGTHRIDWLYSAAGLSMEGQGVGLDGHLYHLARPGSAGWVTAAGSSTSPSDGWLSGSPFWRAGGYWRNRAKGVTFPLGTGGWSAGQGRQYVPLPGITFASGPALPLHYYQSVAVDPRVIPLGSRVYVPAYRHDGQGGWFVAQDTGAAIGGRHIDIYRPPPPSSHDSGRMLSAQRIYVIRPRLAVRAR
jgi:3D (Asp-Asp-Asp) domain-containing protein